MGKYTTVGSVRGCCGHVHSTRDAAEACIEADAHGCASQRGYSDRRVIDGEDYTYAERCLVGGEIMTALSGPEQVTRETLTDRQIGHLRTSAGQAGDIAQAAICDLAMHGSVDRNDYPACAESDWIRAGISSMSQEQAIQECVDVINDAEAQS